MDEGVVHHLVFNMKWFWRCVSVGYPIRSAEELLRRVVTNPALVEEISKNPVKSLQALVTLVTKEIPPLESDVWIYRIVVSSLGAVVFTTVLGAIFITRVQGTVPDILTALGSASVGALAGLLAPSPAKSR